MKFTITTSLPQLDANTSFSAAEMGALAAVVIQHVRRRTAEGRNAFDQPALPLKPKYQRFKVRKGGKPIRDMRLSGETMAALDVLRAGDDFVEIGVPGAATGLRAGINQARDPWLGIAPSGEQEFQRAVDHLTEGLARRIFRRAA